MTVRWLDFAYMQRGRTKEIFVSYTDEPREILRVLEFFLILTIIRITITKTLKNEKFSYNQLKIMQHNFLVFSLLVENIIIFFLYFFICGEYYYIVNVLKNF